MAYAIQNSAGEFLKYTYTDKFFCTSGYREFSKEKTAYEWLKTLGLEISCKVLLVSAPKERKPRSTKAEMRHRTKFSNVVDSEVFDENVKYDESLFKKLNKQCINCKKECKQSSKAVIIRCNDYKLNKIL